MKTLIVFCSVALVAGSCARLQACQREPTSNRSEGLTGRWVGEYRMGGQTTFLSIQLSRKDGQWTGTCLRPTLDWSSELRVVKIGSENSLEFAMSGPDGPLVVKGTSSAKEIRGAIGEKGRSGDIVLVRTADLHREYLDGLAGDYEFPDGGLIVFARENAFLCFLDHRSGRTGRLMPESPVDFWTGPSLGIWYPKAIGFHFLSDSGGNVTGVEIAEGQRKEHARKVQRYQEQNVEIRSGPVVLSGSLKLPPQPIPRPAVLLLAGSNSQTKGGQNGLLGLVGDQFARHGFAVLSYDKRGSGNSGGKRDDDYELLSGDGAAAIGFLRNRPEIDRARIGIWGISQGGQLAPIVASKARRIAFLINVSGSVVNSNQQEIERTELQLRADGFSEQDIADAVHLQQLKFQYACKRDNWDQYKSALDAAKGKKWLPDPYIGPPETQQHSAWDFWKCGVEPALYWESVHVPVLYVYGEHEAYSKPEVNFARFERAMMVAQNNSYTLKRIAGAEHSMTKAKNGGEKELPWTNTYAAEFYPLMTSWASRALQTK